MRLAVQNEYTNLIWETLGVHRLRFPAALFGALGNSDPLLILDRLNFSSLYSASHSGAIGPIAASRLANSQCVQ